MTCARTKARPRDNVVCEAIAHAVEFPFQVNGHGCVECQQTPGGQYVRDAIVRYNAIKASGSYCHECEAAEQRKRDQLAALNTAPGISNVRERTPQRLVLSHYLAPGDVLVLTATIRDLHKAYPGRFATDVRTPYPQLFYNNPYAVTFPEPWINDEARRLWKDEKDHTKVHVKDGVTFINCGYPLVNRCGQPYHFLHGFAQDLEEKLHLRIPLTEFKPEICLSDAERKSTPEIGGHYWIVCAGGKWDYTVKWWVPAYWQEVVDGLLQQGIQVVQIGTQGDYHPALNGAINRVGAYDNGKYRDLVKLVYHSQGIIAIESFLPHLAAAIPLKDGKQRRPGVVIGGNRVPAHFEAYMGQQYLHTNNAMDCGAGVGENGCWKARGTLLGNDSRPCPNTIEFPNTFPCEKLNGKVQIAKCRALITPEDVLRAVSRYYDGGRLVLEAKA